MWAFVPAAGGMLSDMGASVIKVEPPSGDPLRGLQTGGAGAAQHGFVLSWENYNRGKRSITLDLRQPQGVELLYRLLEDADVFRSEEHTSELQSLMRSSYAVFCLKKKNNTIATHNNI